MIYLQNIFKNIVFKSLKTAIYVFSDMWNILKWGKNPLEQNLKGLTSDETPF